MPAPRPRFTVRDSSSLDGLYCLITRFAMPSAVVPPYSLSHSARSFRFTMFFCVSAAHMPLQRNTCRCTNVAQSRPPYLNKPQEQVDGAAASLGPAFTQGGQPVLLGLALCVAQRFESDSVLVKAFRYQPLHHPLDLHCLACPLLFFGDCMVIKLDACEALVQDFREMLARKLIMALWSEGLYS